MFHHTSVYVGHGVLYPSCHGDQYPQYSKSLSTVLPDIGILNFFERTVFLSVRDDGDDWKIYCILFQVENFSSYQTI